MPQISSRTATTNLLVAARLFKFLLKWPKFLADTLHMDVDSHVGPVVADLTSSDADWGRRLGDLLSSGGLDADLSLDVRLATSELVTNAFEHGGAPSLEIRLGIRPEAVDVELTHHDSGTAPQPADSEAPSPESRTGRGMQIASTIATSIDRRVDEGQTVTTLSFNR